jgi:quercetin dioxygenase-like cupin family protein
MSEIRSVAGPTSPNVVLFQPEDLARFSGGDVAIDPRDDPGLAVDLISGATTPDANLTVGYGVFEAHSYHLRHRHPHGSEWFYFLEGGVLLHLAGQDFEIPPRAAVFVPINAVHAIRNAGDKPVSYIYGMSQPDYAQMGLVYEE